MCKAGGLITTSAGHQLVLPWRTSFMLHHQAEDYTLTYKLSLRNEFNPEDASGVLEMIELKSLCESCIH